jgi:hypothetical protein
MHSTSTSASGTCQKNTQKDTSINSHGSNALSVESLSLEDNLMCDERIGQNVHQKVESKEAMEKANTLDESEIQEADERYEECLS